MAERLTTIQDKRDLKRALRAAPDPDRPPSEVGVDEKIAWRNYCRYYRKRLQMIAEDLQGKGGGQHRSPRCFKSYCEALGRNRNVVEAEPRPLGEPAERGFKKAVLPEPGTANAGGKPSGVPAARAVVEPVATIAPPGPVAALPAGPRVAPPAEKAPERGPEKPVEKAPPPKPEKPADSFAHLTTEAILARLEGDVDALVAGVEATEPPIATTLRYDPARVPAEMRPILKEYAEQYANSRWQRPVRVVFEPPLG